jgi:UrcA family protein
MIRILLLLAAAASAGSAAAASRAAAAAGEPFRVAIPVGDLDLASPAGRAAFDARVETLATRACAPRPYPAAYEPRSLERCRAGFRASAEAAAERRTRG